MRAGQMRKLYDYNYWATARILDAARDVTTEQFVESAAIALPLGSLRGTLVHALDTEQSARLRFQGLTRPAALDEDDFATPADLTRAWHEEEPLMRGYLAGLSDDDLSRPFEFAPGRVLPVWELLLHFAYHGAQHRSEAAVLLTHYGHSPGDLDYFYHSIIREGWATL